MNQDLLKEEKKMIRIHIQPAWLTRTEINWLLGNLKVSKPYEYRIKSDIRKKIKTFTDLELPLLVRHGFIDNINLSKYSQYLRTNTQINNQDVSINSPNPENCAQNMVGRKGCVTISVPTQGF